MKFYPDKHEHVVCGFQKELKFQSKNICHSLPFSHEMTDKKQGQESWVYMLLSIPIDFQWQDLDVRECTEASLALSDAFKRYIDMVITGEIKWVTESKMSLSVCGGVQISV